MPKSEEVMHLTQNMHIAFDSLRTLTTFANKKQGRTEFSQLEWMEFVDHFQQMIILEYYLTKFRLLLVEQYLL